MDLDSLKKQLSENGIDYSSWGKAATKTVENLLDEIKRGETTFTKFEGRLLRQVTGIGAHIYFKNGKKLLKLREEKQVFPDGSIRVRDFARSVGGKIKFGENEFNALKREIKEELGIDGNYEIKKIGENNYLLNSPSYPGLLTRSITYMFEVYLLPEQFNEAGYTEKDNGIISYFIWNEYFKINFLWRIVYKIYCPLLRFVETLGFHKGRQEYVLGHLNKLYSKNDYKKSIGK